MVYALNEWYNTYIYNSKMTKISKFLKNGQNLNPKLVLESVLDTDSKNGSGFLWWIHKVPFFYYPKVLFLALLGTLKMAHFVLNMAEYHKFMINWCRTKSSKTKSLQVIEKTAKLTIPLVHPFCNHVMLDISIQLIRLYYQNTLIWTRLVKWNYWLSPF